MTILMKVVLTINIAAMILSIIAMAISYKANKITEQVNKDMDKEFERIKDMNRRLDKLQKKE